jgi:DNA polymerase
MIVGESPGKDEDAQGIPFVGKAGILLNQVLESQGITRDYVYLANITKCRPWEYGPTGLKKNRTPSQEEMDACLPFLDKQVELVKPLFILCLGAVAATNVINPGLQISKCRGLIFNSRFGIPSMATFHPAYVIRKSGKDYTEAYNYLYSDIANVKEQVKLIRKKLKESVGCA